MGASDRDVLLEEMPVDENFMPFRCDIKWIWCSSECFKVKPYLLQICSIIKWNLNNYCAKKTSCICLSVLQP